MSVHSSFWEASPITLAKAGPRGLCSHEMPMKHA